MSAIRSWASRSTAGLAALGMAVLLAACGGGGGGTSPGFTGRNANAGVASVAAPLIAGANVAQIVVDTGTDGSSINSPFVTVRVCEPGTGVCRDIDHVILDTGSTGLRVAASAVTGMNLGAVTAMGQPVGECQKFASGYSWGSVRRADVKMASETASNIPIHVVNDTASNFGIVPGDCTTAGFNVGAGRGANGILGMGLFTHDCGTACVVGTASKQYYSCTAAAVCTLTPLPLGSQVSNPVASFTSGNDNGVAVVLPAVPSGGAALATGWLVFGIGTAAGNNSLGGATVYRTDAFGFFTTTYKGITYPNSFLDTGSNGYFFDDPTLPTCGDFYCPPSTLSLSATNTAVAAPINSAAVSFPLDSVLDIRADAAAAHIGGSIGGPLAGSFDWGLPFFFGRTVFIAISGRNTPAGTGPYWAY